MMQKKTYKLTNYVNHTYTVLLVLTMSRGSIVSIATAYRLDGPGVGVEVRVGSRIFTSPDHPGQLWGPPNLPSIGYWELFLWG
jgi:hypothetical protein